MEPYYGRPIPEYPYSAIVYKDGNKVIARDMDGKLIAKGESGKDDTSVIQSALNVGGRIFIKNGSYYIDKILYIHTGTELIGDNRNTILIRNNNIEGLLTNKNSMASGYSGDKNITIRNIVINCNGYKYNNQNCTPIAFIHCENILIDNVEVFNQTTYWHAIEVNAVNNARISNCYLHNPEPRGGEAINIDIAVEGAWINTNANFDATPSKNIWVVNNKTENYNYGCAGMHRGGPFENIYLIGNDVSGFIYCGFILGDARNTVVSSNIIHDSSPSSTGNAGIYVPTYSNKLYNITIDGNIIKNANTGDLRGIWIKGSSTIYGENISISNNIIDTVARHGISLDYCNKATIRGNIVINNGYVDSTTFAYTIYYSNKCIMSNNIADNVTKWLWLNMVDNVVVTNNQFLNYTVDTWLRSGNFIVKNNVGIVTENHGTFTITGDGSTTTFTIPHGLVSTPTYVNVIQKGSSPKPDSIDWDDTNITLTFNTAPESGTYYYAWEARI